MLQGKELNMKNKYSVWALLCAVSVALAGCAGTENQDYEYEMPTVDYVESLNVNNAAHDDSFLNQLAMNYRSYAIYNAKTSGYPDVAELFAQKAVSAFSGETPFPESLNAWQIADEGERFEIYTAYNDLINELKNDAVIEQPQLAAEAQAKFDCWISAAATGQNSTASECRKRFQNTLHTLKDCSNGTVIPATRVKSENLTPAQPKEEQYYPETRRLKSMSGVSRVRDGIVFVNNVSVIQPVHVPQQKPQPMVFNQNIYGGDDSSNSGDEVFNGSDSFDNSEKVTNTKTVSNSDAFNNTESAQQPVGDYVSRDEFIDLMMAMREELAAINARLDGLNDTPEPSNEKTIIKVQQIPLEPRQRIMEEIFEIRFDFDKAIIKPEYENIIRQLAATTQANKNVKVSVVGHTDTVGSDSYNYALGGRRAEAVQKMLIEYGIPSAQIVAVSAGKEDLKVWTPDNTPNAENRRVRVVKETQYLEPQEPAPLIVEEYSESDDCTECDEK